MPLRMHAHDDEYSMTSLLSRLSSARAYAPFSSVRSIRLGTKHQLQRRTIEFAMHHDNPRIAVTIPAQSQVIS
jgi:hypothetical protein